MLVFWRPSAQQSQGLIESGDRDCGAGAEVVVATVQGCESCKNGDLAGQAGWRYWCLVRRANRIEHSLVELLSRLAVDWLWMTCVLFSARPPACLAQVQVWHQTDKQLQVRATIDLLASLCHPKCPCLFRNLGCNYSVRWIVAD